MTDLHYLTLVDAADALRARTLSAVELCESMLERIARHDPVLHAYTTVVAEHARAQARRAEDELGRGVIRGPLHGVPIAVKDLCDTAGIRTTAGLTHFADRVPATTATVVQRLMDAGAVLLGKLKMAEGASVLHHPSVKAPVNPWNARVWSGASSSGSGVATAAGLCFGSLGTDTAGSIRFPSACNGVVGLKPTLGRVPKDGVFPLAPSLDHVGPMTRSVRDAARMLDVIAGCAPGDPVSSREPAGAYEASLGEGVRGLRIGIDETYCTTNVDADLARGVLGAAATLERLGAILRPVEVPDLDVAVDAFVVIFHAEIAAVHREMYAQHPEKYGAHLAGMIDVGLRTTGPDYAAAHEARLRFTGRLRALFDDIDVLVCPPALTPALPLEVIEGTPTNFADMKITLPFTVPYNLAGVPSLTLPSGFRGDGIPLATQLVAAPFRESLALRAGHAFENATDYHRRRPNL